jgi:hypothetical protein
MKMTCDWIKTLFVMGTLYPRDLALSSDSTRILPLGLTNKSIPFIDHPGKSLLITSASIHVQKKKKRLGLQPN